MGKLPEDYWVLGTFLETIINYFVLDVSTFTKEKTTKKCPIKVPKTQMIKFFC